MATQSCFSRKFYCAYQSEREGATSQVEGPVLYFWRRDAVLPEQEGTRDKAGSASANDFCSFLGKKIGSNGCQCSQSSAR